MHPALSVIFFTVVSGTGYGLLFLLGLIVVIEPHLVGRAQLVATLIAGMAFAAAGLSSSLLHLGQPQRAWRALSQWRSSWLSREGVSAIASFIPAFALGIAAWLGASNVLLRSLGLTMLLLAVLTVCCTAKIYSSLKTVRAWHNAYVLPAYLLFGLLGGALWYLTVQLFFRASGAKVAQIAVSIMIVILACIAIVLKGRYWNFVDRELRAPTTGHATGLDRFGRVSSVEQPHTEENYLTAEMGFVVARKHSARLRSICLWLAGWLPVILTLISLALNGRNFWLDASVTAIAVICVTAGLFVERWLFFAEARHAVMSYYGNARD